MCDLYSMEKALSDFKGLKVTLMRLYERRNNIVDLDFGCNGSDDFFLTVDFRGGVSDCDKIIDLNDVISSLEARWGIKFESFGLMNGLGLTIKLRALKE